MIKSVTYNVTSSRKNEWDEATNDEILAEIHKMNDQVKMLDIEDDMLSTLKTLDYDGFIKLGMEYSDAVIKSKEELGESLQLLLEDIKESKKVDTIEKSENFTESYLELYNELVG